jgi:triosephosphate isomerase
MAVSAAGDPMREPVAGNWKAGLTTIICVGETQSERDAGKALHVVGGRWWAERH